jgi:MOSC domain-containing protein YiiM
LDNTHQPGARIVALFTGLPRSRTVSGRTLFTGGAKDRVESAFLGFDGFQGDGQGNLRNHGGRDRSVCVYPAGHYPWWEAAHGIDLREGAFCENLVVDGVQESAVCIGDVFRAGSALVQVTLPRDPCRTLDLLSGVSGLWKLARDSGRCGFHMRTLEEGTVRSGDPFEIVQRHPAHITVAAALDLFHGRSTDLVLARRLIDMPDFGEQGRRHIAERLGLERPS